jgi:hypothetical protein
MQLCAILASQGEHQFLIGALLIANVLIFLAVSLSTAVLLAIALQPWLFSTLGLFLIAALMLLLGAAFLFGHEPNSGRADAN